jgi:hypothetical protein
MGVLIRNSSGSLLVQYWVDKITESKVHRTVVQDLPTANYDYIQSLGTKNRSFVVDGGVSGSGVSQIRAMPGTTGSMLAVDAYGSEIVPLTQIFVNDVKFSDDANNPTFRKFTMSITEVV